eukprot:571455-Alexandrium_andersonii.AAC.2
MPHRRSSLFTAHARSPFRRRRTSSGLPLPTGRATISGWPSTSTTPCLPSGAAGRCRREGPDCPSCGLALWAFSGLVQDERRRENHVDRDHTYGFPPPGEGVDTFGQGRRSPGLLAEASVPR